MYDDNLIEKISLKSQFNCFRINFDCNFVSIELIVLILIVSNDLNLYILEEFQH